MGSVVTANIMVSKIILIFISSCTAQLKFGGSTGSSDNTNTGAKQPETDTRFFTGNQALDGGIVGLGAGLLGGAVLSGALSGGGNNGCGRRRRQAEGTNTKFLELCWEGHHLDVAVGGGEGKHQGRISLGQGSLAWRTCWGSTTTTAAPVATTTTTTI